jgi:hypothetical protein
LGRPGSKSILQKKDAADKKRPAASAPRPFIAFE